MQMQTQTQTKEKELTVDELQNQIECQKERAEHYEKWYFEKTEEVRILKQFISNLGNQVEIFNKSSKI